MSDRNTVSSGDWWELLTPDELRIYGGAGYGQELEWGERPALVVVDTTYAFVGPFAAPVLESIETFPTSCGEAGWRAVEQIARVLEGFRGRQLPVFYTRGLADRTDVTAGAWRWKKTKLTRHPNQAMANTIPPAIAPRPGETVIQKTKPSAFFGTPFASYLTGLRIDTLVVVGGTTSGCVRATVVDAFSSNLRTIVVEEAVFDRATIPHLANLLDMQSKYAQVVSVDRVLARLADFGRAEGQDLGVTAGDRSSP